MSEYIDEILIAPDLILSTPCELVTDFNTELVELVANMRRILSQQDGGKLGLAANQIGVNKRVALVLGTVVVNPIWTPCKQQTVNIRESCYSIGKEYNFPTTRAKYGWAKFQDIDGVWKEDKLTEMAAIVYQHEVDHLNGILCMK